MEYLNKVELRGVVGSVIRTQINKRTLVRLSIVTNHAYKSSDGSPVIESTWHNVSAWDIKTNDVEHIEKGSKVHVVGRIRHASHTMSSGEVIEGTEVLANSLELISSNERLEIEV